MIRISQYLQAPTKLQSVLSYCNELSDEKKHKVCLIQDIARIRRLMEFEPMSSKVFYTYYDADTLQLEILVYALTVELNTYMYKQRCKEQNQPLQGADF